VIKRRSEIESPYLEFSKLYVPAKYNLASSAVMTFPLLDLPVRLDEIELNGPGGYGFAPLLERIAQYNKVSPECVMATAGTSMANQLAMAATFDHGDEVLIEYPTYEALVSAAEYLGAQVRYFERRRENNFAVDPEVVRRQITPRTRLIVLANLHNPTGAYIPQETLHAVGEIAATNGARVLVDEVYLEALYEQRPPTAFHFGEHFIVTSSLTKAFGLGGLRCGWVLASPDLVQRMWRLNDLYGSNAPHPSECLSVLVFDHLDRISARAQHILRTNRTAFGDFLTSLPELDCVVPEHGAIFAPRVGDESSFEFCRMLEQRYETSVVAGEYFYMPGYVRVGIGGDPEMTREGLERLGQAIREVRC
jgi:aspartate/methionine/tyrosine aminotransferase